MAKEKTTLTDVEMLGRKIEASGLGPVALAAAWGVSLPTYYSAKNGESEFTASMIAGAVRSLGLTRSERDAIFFGE